jgi:membrane dipeptidase
MTMFPSSTRGVGAWAVSLALVLLLGLPPAAPAASTDYEVARALVDHPRDVPDDILALVARNGAVVMVNFASAYVSAARNQWEADRAAEQARYNTPPYGGLYIGQPDRAKAALDRYPALLVELMRRGWSDPDVAKLAGENVLRVMAEAERVSVKLRAGKEASEATVAQVGPAAQ